MEEKTKTIYITRFPFKSQLGGEELHTLAVAKHYRKQGHEVVFMTSCPVLISLADKEGFRVRKMWLYRPPVSAWSLLWFSILSPLLFLHAFGVITKMKLQDKDVVFYMLSFGEKLLMTPFLWSTRTPVIWLEHARIGNWFWKNPWKFWYKLWAKRVTLVTVSERMVMDLGIKSAKLIPNAVKVSFFKKLRDAEILPENLKSYFRDSKLHVGYAGRLTRDKGTGLLIEAAKKLPDLAFIAVGEGPEAARLERNGVHVHSKVDRDQIVAFMQSVDIFVLPSTEVDPFGLVVLEAMAAGTAVICTDLCGVSDYLDSEKDAIVCKVNDFVESLEKLARAETKRKKIAKHGQKKVERDFSYEEMLEAYEDLLG